MPFLRVIRDKRGYETTYLMHWYREGTKQRSRILYVFRTPGGVRVGRDAMDPDVLRTIESNHPGIEFDWKSVLSNRQVVESAPEQRRTRKRKPSDDPAPAAATESGPAAAPAAAPPAARLSIPSALHGTTPDEQIVFLNEWYPIVRDYIPKRTADPVRLDALLALAERLNPANWTDADQIAGGLQRAAEALERLSRVFARRRRRPRRVAPRGAPPAPPDRPPSSDS